MLFKQTSIKASNAPPHSSQTFQYVKMKLSTISEELAHYKMFFKPLSDYTNVEDLTTINHNKI